MGFLSCTLYITWFTPLTFCRLFSSLLYSLGIILACLVPVVVSFLLFYTRLLGTVRTFIGCKRRVTWWSVSKEPMWPPKQPGWRRIYGDRCTHYTLTLWINFLSIQPIAWIYTIVTWDTSYHNSHSITTLLLINTSFNSTNTSWLPPRLITPTLCPTTLHLYLRQRQGPVVWPLATMLQKGIYCCPLYLFEPPVAFINLFVFMLLACLSHIVMYLYLSFLWQCLSWLTTISSCCWIVLFKETPFGTSVTTAVTIWASGPPVICRV